jgi:NitT/TauT family transport system substrate-binding protein
MEQFVVRKGLNVRTLADLKGKKIMSAPGPANVSMARAVLAVAGLKEGDYQLDQLDMGQHVNAMTAGTFDAGYTLEPNAAIMRRNGVATTLEAGVIAKYILGDPRANAWVGGGVISTDFMKNRPDVAKRYAVAWAKAIDFINADPKEARKSLLKNTLTPDDLVDSVPLVKFVTVASLTNTDRQDFQTFIDYSTRMGTLSDRVDVNQYLQRF